MDTSRLSVETVEEAAANTPGEATLSQGSPSSPLDLSQSSSKGSDSPEQGKAPPLRLLTAAFDEKIYALQIIAGGASFPLPPGYALQDSFIGNDGNKFYCQVCKELGEIVCCDGCPRAYHPDCLPEEGESRLSLLRDDDPWFCPFCWETRDTQKQDESCDNVGYDATQMDQKEYLGQVTEDNKQSLSLEEPSHNGYHEGEPQAQAASEPPRLSDSTNGRKRRARAISPKPPPQPPQSDTDSGTKEEDDVKKSVKRRKKKEPKEVRKRRVRIDSNVERPRGRANSASSAPQQPSPALERMPIDPLIAALGDRTHAHGLVQATPAFYYFLSESRWKIERSLSKSHRYFNRLSKGNMERNALVAKEAANWWTKLRPSEYQRYVNMSMQDFERRIMEWKEDKNAQEMAVVETEDWMVEPQSMADTKDDMDLQQALHERLYEAASVGHKPIEQVSDRARNKVLLAALHDVRFCAPSAIFSVDREKERTDDGDAKPSIPVHGPVATSVGDECIGCTRGWSHYCPVLRKRLPAVKRRAKVQTGLSSLVATRVGLGLRPRKLLQEDSDESFASPVNHEEDTIEWRKTKQQQELVQLPPLPSSTLTDPTERADDVAMFVEGALALSLQKRKGDGFQSAAIESCARGSNQQVKCGRCRRSTDSEGGCVPCQRSRLVAISAKQRNSDRLGNLVVKSVILGRLRSKEKTVELSEADRLVAKRLLKRDWLPVALLPPKPVPVPRPSVDQVVSESGNSVLYIEKVEDEQQSSTPDADGLLRPSVAADLSTIDIDNELLNAAPGSTEESLDLNGTIRDVGSDWDRRKRAVFIVCAGMFMAVARRDPLRLFTDSETTTSTHDGEGSRPSCLNAIRLKILDHGYADVRNFTEDVWNVHHKVLELHPKASSYIQTASEISSLLSAMKGKTKTWIQTLLGTVSPEIYDELGDDRDCRGSIATFKAPSANLFGKNKQDDRAQRAAEQRLRELLESDFMRSRENEVAFYGTLAIRRATTAAQSSLAPYPNSLGQFSCIGKRSHEEDELLWESIDLEVAALKECTRIQDDSSYRDESVIRLLNSVRSRRLGLRMGQTNTGCSRCNEVQEQSNAHKVAASQMIRRSSLSKSATPRIDCSRLFLSTGMGSDETSKSLTREEILISDTTMVQQRFVSVRKSNIHGLGLFADKAFDRGDVICEYVGETCSLSVADARQYLYIDRQQKSYVFRGDGFVVDATRKGGPARYINHSCQATCSTKIVSTDDSTSRRVFVVAQTPIAIDDEITYDYQMPIELDLSGRIPCHCLSPDCRGFMNWPCPEKKAKPVKKQDDTEFG